MKSMRKCAVLFAAVLLAAASVRAQTVDTVEVYSPSMDKKIKNVVILPAGYGRNAVGRYPVVYLLHGYNNRYDSWLRKTKPELPQTASAFGVIVVCPDGESSWYWDSPVNPRSRYETYVGTELVAYVDAHYRTVPDRRGRAITGYSMGGHGALWLAFRHPDVFGACGSMSGGVDIRPFPNNWKISEQLGPYAENRAVWDEHTVLSQLYRVVPFTDANREVASTKARPVDYGLQPGQLDGRLFFRGQPEAPRADAVLSYFPRLHRAARTTYARLLAQRGRVPFVFFSAFFRYATEPVGRAYLNSSALYSGCLSR